MRLLCGLADMDLAMIFRKLEDFFAKKCRTLWEIDTRSVFPVRRGERNAEEGILTIPMSLFLFDIRVTICYS